MCLYLNQALFYVSSLHLPTFIVPSENFIMHWIDWTMSLFTSHCDVIDISEGFKQLTFVLHCGLLNFELYIIHLHLPQHWILRFSRDSNYKPRSIHLSCWAKGGKESIILFHKWDSNFGLQAQKSETLPLIHHRVTRPSYWKKSFFIIDSK